MDRALSACGNCDVSIATKKPWAIDVSYFTACKRAVYLTNMAVRPDYQNRGIGRKALSRRCASHASGR